MTEVERRQLELYAQKVQQRAADRFENEAELVNWFNNGRVPGFGTKSPLQLVKEGFGAQVIEAINAVEAGVYA